MLILLVFLLKICRLKIRYAQLCPFSRQQVPPGSQARAAPMERVYLRCFFDHLTVENHRASASALGAKPAFATLDERATCGRVPCAALFDLKSGIIKVPRR